MEKLIDRLTRIRQQARTTAANSSGISINELVLRHVAHTVHEWSTPASLNPVAASGMLTINQKIGLTLFFGVINYCYVEPRSGIEYAYHINGQRHRRSAAFTQALIEAGMPWDQPSAIADMSYATWRKILHLDQAGVVLFDEEGRIQRLRQFGDYLQTAVATFDNFFERYPDAQSIYELLMPSGLFEDEFLKRLQVVIAWLADIARSANLRFNGATDSLTVMADYRLPQVLIQEGVITISDEIRAQLGAELRDIQTEYAIRAATITAGESIASIAGMTTTEVDRALWQRSQSLIESGTMNAPAMRVAARSY